MLPRRVPLPKRCSTNPVSPRTGGQIGSFGGLVGSLRFVDADSSRAKNSLCQRLALNQRRHSVRSRRRPLRGLRPATPQADLRLGGWSLVRSATPGLARRAWRARPGTSARRCRLDAPGAGGDCHRPSRPSSGQPGSSQPQGTLPTLPSPARSGRSSAATPGDLPAPLRDRRSVSGALPGKPAIPGHGGNRPGPRGPRRGARAAGSGHGIMQPWPG